MAGVRATDQDRDKAVEVIEDAYAKGQLNDAERELRTQKALQATTIPELASLVSDLQPATSATFLKTKSPESRRLLPIAALAAIAVLGVGALLFAGHSGESDLDNGSLPPTANPFPSEFPSKPVTKEIKGSLLSEKGFAGMVGQVRKKFGSTAVVDAVVYPEYASFTVPLKDNTRHTERWSFRGGFTGTPSQGNRFADDPLIDLGKVNVKSLTRAIRQSKTSLGVEDVSTTYLIFDKRDDQPAMSVYVSNDFHDTAYTSLALNGKEIYTYRFK